MSSRHHRRNDGGGGGIGAGNDQARHSPPNPTYAALASLRDGLRASKANERKAAAKDLLERLSDSGTLRRLEAEAERMHAAAVLREQGSRRGGGGGGGGGGEGSAAALPWDRVCILYRSVMDAALLSSRTLVGGGGGSGDDSTIARPRKRTHANQTGFTKKSCKFTADDVLFPYNVFLRMDADQALECGDGGYGGGGGSAGGSGGAGSGGGGAGSVAAGGVREPWEEDWKTRPRYGHHLDVAGVLPSSSKGQRRPSTATHYAPHAYTDRHRGSRLTPKEVLSCVDYAVHCLNDDECTSLATVESRLLAWLAHICSRPEYLAALPVHDQLAHVLHEASTRLSRAFVDGHRAGGGRGALLSFGSSNGGGGGGRRAEGAVSQECLLASAKILSAISYNCTTRLGTSMVLYVRPVVDLVAGWAEDAWRAQSEGEYATSVDQLAAAAPKVEGSSATAARNPHTKMIEDGQLAPSSSSLHRRRLRTEADILALVPYLYSSVTHLVSMHPEQSVPILSDHGHALLRLARRNYARAATSAQAREALTEYVCAHLTVAEASGRIFGLPEGDLGPLAPTAEESDGDDRDRDGGDDGEGGDGSRRERDDRGGKTKKRKRKGGTLDAKSVHRLLEMVRNEKVWESLFGQALAGSGQDGKKKKGKSRRSLPSSGRGGSASSPEGGATWTPLSRRQRRHLELLARLVRVAQRLHVAEAEERGDGTSDALESLMEGAERAMRSSGVERGEIDILPREEGGTRGPGGAAADADDADGRHAASPSDLARSPWVCMVCRHLYRLNPKLGGVAAASASPKNASLTQQDTARLTQAAQGSDAAQNDPSTPSWEQSLLEACPMLQALVIDEAALLAGADSASADDTMLTMTQGTLTAPWTLTAPTSRAGNRSPAAALDAIRPTAAATLQFLCACIEAFPRGECWSSSARQNWSSVVDEGPYPPATLATVLERHGSSPADAAAVVYLLGTTLEAHGGSVGEGDVQLWTLIALLKMTESSAIICSRDGLSDAASFALPSSLGALRASWQYVWRTVFRHDLRYSSYTSGAFNNNVGELVVQLLTQIVRYQCIDRKALFVCRPPPAVRGGGAGTSGKALAAQSASTRCPFIHGEQGQIWKLPMFDDASTVFSCAPFELITSVVQCVGFSDVSDVAALASSVASRQMASSVRDRRWFVSFCLRFFELAMGVNAESSIRRTFLPFAATCLSSLVSEGGTLATGASTFELDGLTRFAITEDVEPLNISFNPDHVENISATSLKPLFAALWAESITPHEYPNGIDRGLALRIVQGRGAFMNRYLNAQYEREHLQYYASQSGPRRSGAGVPLRSPLGGMLFEAIKACLDEVMFQLKYEDGSASDDEERENSGKGANKPLALVQLTGCLSLIISVLLAEHPTIESLSRHICSIFEDTLAPAFDVLAENFFSLQCCPSDLITVLRQLHGVVRVFTSVAASGGGGMSIPRLFGHHAKSFWTLCERFLKQHRNESCAPRASGQAASRSNGGFNSDSDDGRQAPTQISRSNFSDDSDGLMDDDDDNGTRVRRPRQQRAPPSKRRRIGNGPPRTRRDNPREDDSMETAIDSRGAWACASLMLLLKPSFRTAETISSHLVWPEDFNGQHGYCTLSKTPDPFAALVCASLFCQKTVLLRRDRLHLKSGRGEDEDEDQESAFILAVEVVLQARRTFPPSSRYFMYGHGLVADMVKIGDYGESCGPLGEDESKIVLEAMYPEGLDKSNNDYFLLRQWTRRISKFRSSYRSQQVHAATRARLYGQRNVHNQFDGLLFSSFILPSFCQIDENIRTEGPGILGAAMITLPASEKTIVSDVFQSALPRLDSHKKFKRWVNNSLVDQKLRDELAPLEEEALSDVEFSLEFSTIECIGCMAGNTSDETIARDLVWRLIDLASKKPTLLLPCYRACNRAARLMMFKSLGAMFDNMMPHLLVKWLESRRNLRDFPIFLMSPFAVDRACRNFPNEILSMLLTKGGWSDDYFSLDEIEGGARTLNQSVLTPFIDTVSKFLIPNILLSASDGSSASGCDEERLDTTKYLTECVIILREVDSDENVAKVLINHIADLYGFVAVLAENGDATLECENAFKFIKRCISDAHIERNGAKNAFLVLRHILLLHRLGLSVVGLGDTAGITSASFIEGMKYVAKQLKAPSNGKESSFLVQLGSSMTESVVLVKYWLSSSQTKHQREQSWKTMALLSDILSELILSGKIEAGELGFCLHSFMAMLLDPENDDICPQVLESLAAVLEALFSKSTKETLVVGSMAVLHKLSLALLETHQRAHEHLYAVCESILLSLEYEQKSSQGLLSAVDEQKSWDSLGESPWGASSQRDEVLKHLIASKGAHEERVSSDTMLRTYECLAIVANSGKMQLEDILGADDIVFQSNLKEEAFRSVNEKYSMLTFFNSLQQRPSAMGEANLDLECDHFIRIMKDHPISTDIFRPGSSSFSHDVLARRLALRRLESVLALQGAGLAMCEKVHADVYYLLLSICHSQEPEESRVISSRCLGELSVPRVSLIERSSSDVNESLSDPILAIKKTILAMLGQYLLSECAVSALIAMKTAKALLVTPAGKECWQSLSGDVKGLLSPFNAHDDGKLRREAVKVSESCVDRLKSGCSDSDSWCWREELWSCPESEESSCDLWIRKVTCSIIECCFGRGSQVSKGDQDFFRICQGLCAKEASFSASVFPALIFHLLDSEAREKCTEEGGVRDTIMSSIAIGSPTSGMNKAISRCFSSILHHDVDAAPQAITVVLNTLELLRAITEHRFITSSEHIKNKSAASQKQSSSLSKKRRSRNPSESVEAESLGSSPRWRGFPYGIVVSGVSGLDVAHACFRVKRYYSALYYAEMSMNNLIGTGTFFEDAVNDSFIKNNEATGCCDISGFGVLTKMEESQAAKVVLEKALVAKDVIGRCLSELHARDEVAGVVMQGSALMLKRNIVSLDEVSGAMNGLHKDGGENLREKWFEDSLNETSQWDDMLLPRLETDSSLAPLPHQMFQNRSGAVYGAMPPPPTSDEPAISNFYESVHEALQSYAKVDVTGGLGHLWQARRSVIADMEHLAGSEAQSTGIITHLAKLKALGQLERVALTLEGKSDLTNLLNHLGCHEDAGGGTLASLLLNENANFDNTAKENIEEIDDALFGSIRTVFSVKEVALKVLVKQCSSAQDMIVAALSSHIHKACGIYRDLGRADAAGISVSSLRSLFQRPGIADLSSGNLALLLRLEDAKIMKSTNELDGAIMHCKMVANHLMNTKNDSTDIERLTLTAESLLLGGLWMAQNNVDSSETVLSSYFEKAAKLAMQIHKKAPTFSSIHRAATSNFKLGEFAAALYSSVDARMSSEAWKRRNIAAEDRRREMEAVAAQVKKLQKKSRSKNDDAAYADAFIIHATLSREVQMDDRELTSVQNSLQRYLHLAVESYCSALKLCPTTVTDVSKYVFQLVSMWFKNCQRNETKDIVNGLLKSNVSQIPSYRLVPLTYQLFSRIDEPHNDTTDGFQSLLRDIVIKICSEHPYHGIVQLLALSNGQRIGGGVNGRHGNAYLENIGTSKVDAVNRIIQELQKQAPEYVSELISGYSALMIAYMNVAEYDTTQIQKRTHKGISFKQLKLDLDTCLSGGSRRGRNSTATGMPAIITKPPPIRPDANYGNGTEDPIGTERVVGFESTFDLTLTGLHRPKIVKCIGSKGGKFKQLVKGEDDLRQDAIMQQVFGTVNDLLRHEGSSGSDFLKSFGDSIGTTRRLRLITYGITPLSPASGVLEWVDSTMCFGDFLTDRGKKVGAHSKYYPGEWGNNDVREFYRIAAEAHDATPETKRKAFDTICDNFSPAFRFFFLEYFTSSMEQWHTARTLYTRSCAVNSIVGHILGIGDRHTSNILVHTKTGEVVHIDFGIVFEQGKTLTTPELVPFRLTRDVVDGMGPSGTDGVFSKAAEATMGVMRANADTLLTILSAVVSDPLYKWSLSPLKANQHQRTDDEEGARAGRPSARLASTADENRNDAADRAIAKIHEKLEGYEDGTSGEHKTIAGQVKLLINEARDPDNLSVMFSGWAPWM